MIDADDLSDGFWVFAYGSLMWNPGFAHTQMQLATLHGYHRSFCLASIIYRGTPEAPGLVLALDEGDGAMCRGVAYRVDGVAAAGAIDYLRKRELVSSAYQERLRRVDLSEGGSAPAVCYVCDRAHEQYRGGLEPAQQAEVIAHAVGPAGSNVDYLNSTVDRLHALGIEDPALTELRDLVAMRRARAKL